MKQTFTNIYLFLKRNIVYVILTFCVLAVGLSVTLILLTGEDPIQTPVDSTIDGGNNQGSNDQETPVGPSDSTELPDTSTPVGPSDPVVKPEPVVVTFIMPVENATSISEYTTELRFNSTLGRFEMHDAVDFFAPENTDVLAVYDGTVASIEQSPITGYTIVLDHGNNLKTYYNSLSDDITLEVGESVKQGDVIGAVALTNRQEYKAGAHLHFEVFENDKSIDPVKYLDYLK